MEMRLADPEWELYRLCSKGFPEPIRSLEAMYDSYEPLLVVHSGEKHDTMGLK